MKKTEIHAALMNIREAKKEWATRLAEFNSGVDAVMARLLHEASANFMSVEEVALTSGFTVKRVRELMRRIGLNPKEGKRLLSKKAAEALANNSVLLGIEPHEMDLMSPLAYLPMGEQMKRELQDKTVSQVHEVSGNGALVHTINYFDDEIACGLLGFDDPVLITNDDGKITCATCRIRTVRE